MNEIYVIEDRETGLCYRRITGLSFVMVDDPNEATHFNANDISPIIEFLGWLGLGVVSKVHVLSQFAGRLN